MPGTTVVTRYLPSWYFIGIGGTYMDMPKLDIYAAIVVALMIIKIGVELGYNSMQELADKGLDPDVVEKIREQILSHEDVRRTAHAAHPQNGTQGAGRCTHRSRTQTECF